MTFSIVHLSDPHFGRDAMVEQIEAVEHLVPDLAPNVIVLSGDLTQRARHGELQRARAWVRALGRTAPVYVLPGNHDVQWWWRPLLPFGVARKYRKFRRYFGPVLAPTLELPEAVLAGVVTAHGVAWGSLTPRLRDIAVKGHLPRREVERVRELFARADPSRIRILVMHHNLLRGDRSRRMGLARWRQAQRRVLAAGADLVLCGHDHQEAAEMVEDVVVSCAGTLCSRVRGDGPASFNRVTIEDDAIHVQFYRWDAARDTFRPSDRYQFARPPRPEAQAAETAGRRD